MIADNYVPTKDIGNGITVNFSFPWNMLSDQFSKVFLEDSTTGVQVLQTLGVNYSIVFTEAGGTITFFIAPPSTQFVVISRDTSQDQLVDYTTSKGFDGDVIETSYDKPTGMIQELSDAVARAIKFPVGSANLDLVFPDPEAGKFLVWDSNLKLANGVVGSATNTLPPLSAGEANKNVVVNGAGDGYVYSASTSVAGADQEVQFNNSGAFGASANFKWDGTDILLMNAIGIKFGNTGQGEASANGTIFLIEGTTGVTLDLRAAQKLELRGGTGIDVFNDIVLATTNTFKFDLGTSINEFSTDGTMAGDSDDAVPTEKAVKTFVDTEIAGAAGLGISNLFCATMSGTTAGNTLTATKVQFDTEDFDIAADFNITNNNYTAPSNGKYYFSFSLEITVNGLSAGAKHDIDITKNGTRFRRLEDITDRNLVGETINGSIILDLITSDVIDIRLAASGGGLGTATVGGDSTFCGYKLTS